MAVPATRFYRLASRGEAGLACDDDGLALGPVPLSRHDGAGKRRFRLRPAEELTKALRLAYGPVPAEDLARYRAGLGHIAALLEAGEGAQARIRAVQLRLPEISPEGMAKLAEDATLRKFNPDWAKQSRVPGGQSGGGQWMSGGAGSEVSDASRAPPGENQSAREQHGRSADTRLEPTATALDETQAKKERFVAAHLADAEKAAKELGVPVENILGLSAYESGWGKARFASEGNNYFGIHYPAPFATGPMLARRKGGGKYVRVAIFASYAKSLRSFVVESGKLVRGASDPVEFMTVLQSSGKYGIDPDTGAKDPTYVSRVASTIRGLRSIIERKRKARSL